jgi:hypothetical protein
MIEWEVVRKSFGAKTVVDSWISTGPEDAATLKNICNNYTHDGAVIELYFSCPGFEHELGMVTGKRQALASHGYPNADMDPV